MTKREKFEQLKAIVDGAEISTEEQRAELIEFCEKEIERLDAAAKRSSAKREQKLAEDKPLIEEIVTRLSEDRESPVIASDIGEALGVSTPKASSLLRRLVAEGVAVSEDVKVGKRKVKGYFKA